MKNRFIPKMNIMIRRRENAIDSGKIKLETLENERRALKQKIAETNRKIALETANILNEVDIKYQKLLSDQLNNLKCSHEEVIRQLRTKYTEDIEAMAEAEADKIDWLSDCALQKLACVEKRI